MLGCGELDELHLFELVLANETACVLAIRAGLAAKAWRVRAERPRQRGAVENLVTIPIGHRHLSRRNEVKRLLATEFEQILFELRKLSGASQRIRIHDERREHLGITLLLMDVQHQGDERAIELRR